MILVLGGLGVGVELALAGLGPAALVAGGMAETTAALWASGFFVAFLGARLALWWLADRVAPMRLLAAAFALAGIASAAAALGGGGPAYAVAGGAVAIIYPAYFIAATRRLGGSERLSALITAAAYVGATLVPGILSPALAQVGIVWLFPAMAVYCAVSAGLTLATRARD